MVQELHPMRRADDKRITALERDVIRIDTRETSCQKNVNDTLERFEKKIDRLFMIVDGMRDDFAAYREKKAYENGASQVERTKIDGEQNRQMAVIGTKTAAMWIVGSTVATSILTTVILEVVKGILAK